MSLFQILRVKVGIFFRAELNDELRVTDRWLPCRGLP
jgi:hypothetical protein